MSQSKVITQNMKTRTIQTQFFSWLKLTLLLVLMVFAIQGCFFGGDGDRGLSDDACSGINNNFAPAGTSSADCEAANGQWIDGRCYCSGE